MSEELAMNESKAHAEGVFQGKVLAFLDQWKEFSTSWMAHIAADDKNFKEIREEIANIKAEIGRSARADDLSNLKITMNWYAGAAAVIGALAGTILPMIIQQIFK